MINVGRSRFDNDTLFRDVLVLPNGSLLVSRPNVSVACVAPPAVPPSPGMFIIVAPPLEAGAGLAPANSPLRSAAAPEKPELPPPGAALAPPGSMALLYEVTGALKYNMSCS